MVQSQARMQHPRKCIEGEFLSVIFYVEWSNNDNLCIVCSVTRKMTQKYGEFTNDPAFQKKKWWQNIPGMG